MTIRGAFPKPWNKAALNIVLARLIIDLGEESNKYAGLSSLLDTRYPMKSRGTIFSTGATKTKN
jgi:hypothetical protein